MANIYSKYYAVTGIGGNPIPRPDLLKMLESNEQMYLYLEGMKRFQQVDPQDPLSWFQIAGIHGRPYMSWPAYDTEIKPTGNQEDKSLRGFCTHSSMLFLTWHRPYLALFEFALSEHVKLIAEGIDKSHPEKQKYMDLAKQFRIPYWDWARKTLEPVPTQVLQKDYRGPDGPLSTNFAKKRDYNPLFAYTLPKDDVPGLPPGELKMIKTFSIDKVPKVFEDTVRYPGENPEEGPATMLRLFYAKPYYYIEDPKKRNPNFKPPVGQNERNLTERTTWILQAYSTFAAVSNNSFRYNPNDPEHKKKPIIEDKENWGSLEDIHNTIHNLCGGGGNMSSIPQSAFDPIFWLHHTNIDRLYAIWQAVHETEDDKSFVTPRVNGWGNYVAKAGVDEETKDTPLFPFKMKAEPGSWYTSKETKRTERFGYSYQETAGLTWPPTAAEQATVIKTITNLYGSLPSAIQNSINNEPDAGAEFLPQVEIAKMIANPKTPATAEELGTLISELPQPDALLEDSNKAGKPRLRDLAPEREYLEWIFNIKVLKHALGGNFSVHVFLGPADDEPDITLWPKVPTHVGTFAPLGQSMDTSCNKCKEDQQRGLEVTGQIPLTIALVERYLAGLIDNLSPDVVVPYLQTNLHWRIVDGTGNVVHDRERAHDTGLTVFVISNAVQLPSDKDALPAYAPDVTLYPEVTTNKQNQSRGNGTGLTAAFAY